MKFDASHMLTARVPSSIRAEIARMPAAPAGASQENEASAGMSDDQLYSERNQRKVRGISAALSFYYSHVPNIFV